MEETNILTFFSKETALHGLINNAGIMGVPFSRTKDGYEIQFQVLSTLLYERAILSSTGCETNDCRFT